MRRILLLVSFAATTQAFAVEALSPGEMATVTGGTIEPDLAQIDVLTNAIEQAQEGQLSNQESLDALFALGNLLSPLSQFLNYQREVVGVDYGDREPQAVDGGVSLALPVYVERITYWNIQPAVPSAQGDMGTVHIEGLRFSDEARVVVRER